MTYVLYDYDPQLPPILMENIPLGFGGGPVIEKNYIIGSAIFTDSNFNRVEPSNAKYFPDPNWKKYPKNMYPSIFGIIPIDSGITTYEADNDHYIYYQPNSPKSREYSRMLRAVFESKRPRAKITPITTPAELKELLKSKTKILKETEEKLNKTKDEISKAKTVYERQLRSERGQEPSMKTRAYEKNYVEIQGTIKVLQNNVTSLKEEIKQLKKIV